MSALQPPPCADVRDLYNRHGADAVRCAPVRIWQPAPGTVPNASTTIQSINEGGKRVFECTRWDKLPHSPDTDDLVEGLLTPGDASVVYGKSNVGKSFWTLDLSAHIATCTSYRGTMSVEGGGAVYVTLEGQRAFRNRLQALHVSGRLRPGAPLYVVMSPVNLLEATDPKELIAAVQRVTAEARVPIRLIVIDTLSRAMPGGDECSGKDMTAAVRAVDEIRSSTGAHVMLVHHCGKDEARGARGHSSLRAAIDTEIEIIRPPGSDVILASVTKQRDLEKVSLMPFSLVPRVLGSTKKGKPITSCTVHHEADIPPPGSAIFGGKKKPKPDIDAVLELAPPADAAIPKKIFLNRVRDELGATVRDADAGVEQLVLDGKLIETRKRTAAGQVQVNICRLASE